MNKKGFTLIELLAVIVILTVVMLMGSVGIGAVKRAINKSMFETKLDFVISAGKTYGQDNKELFMSASGEKINITRTVGDLIKDGSLATEETEVKSRVTNCTKEVKADDGEENRCAVVINPVEGNDINNLTLNIYMENNRVYACIPLTDINKAILNDTSCTKSGCSGDICTWNNCEYSDLNYYCVK